MLPTRRHWRARRALIVSVLAAGLTATALVPIPSAGADQAEDVASAVDDYQDERGRLAEAEAERRGAQDERDAAARSLDDAAASLERAEADLAEHRRRYATISAEYYVIQGADDDVVTKSMHLALSGRREQLDDAKDVHKAADASHRAAEKELRKRESSLRSATEDRDEALADADEAGRRADEAIADTGARDLPAVAYLAYRDAAAGADERHPDCHLSAAVLAGVGRISSGHGRNQGASIGHLGRVEPDLRGLRGPEAQDTDGGEVDGDTEVDVNVGPMQLTPSVWADEALDGNGDGAASPDDLFDAAATTAEVLCAPGRDLDTFVPLDRAVRSLLGESQQSTVALGTARRYARTEGLALGTVPDDPRARSGDGSPQFDVSDTNLAPGDVLGMIDWAMTRLGTPYSQCLGVEARPQDPECPPGTNRFGAGFFDCSGFVSSAYRRIGLSVPVSTYAMEADPSFMGTVVADRIDLAVMEPGDIFLMDGHTGMYVGNGMIIHAIGVGLTHERVPGWVANGTFAVLRPALP